jgi:hypothetical protein
MTETTFGSREFSVDFDKFYEEQEAKKPTPGTYPGKIKSVNTQTSRAAKEKGEDEPDMIVFEAVISGGQYAGTSFKEYCGIPGRRDNMVWKLESTLKAIGWVNDEGRVIGKFEEDDVVGRRVGLKVKDGEFNGEARPELDRLVPHYDGAGDEDNGLPF